MKKDHLESACLDWLAELGWTCAHGEDVSPGGAQCARERYSDDQAQIPSGQAG
jgi:type I restriction enzyme R subunit